jgi:hypothetical protein
VPDLDRIRIPAWNGIFNKGLRVGYVSQPNTARFSSLIIPVSKLDAQIHPARLGPELQDRRPLTKGSR